MNREQFLWQHEIRKLFYVQPICDAPAVCMACVMCIIANYWHATDEFSGWSDESSSEECTET